MTLTLEVVEKLSVDPASLCVAHLFPTTWGSAAVSKISDTCGKVKVFHNADLLHKPGGPSQVMCPMRVEVFQVELFVNLSIN